MLGKKLVALRMGKDFTRKFVVEELKKKSLNISEQCLVNWEKDIYEPDLSDAVKLAEIYSVELKALVG